MSLNEGYMPIISFIAGLLIGLGTGIKSLGKDTEEDYIKSINDLKYRIEYLETQIKARKSIVPIIHP